MANMSNLKKSERNTIYCGEGLLAQIENVYYYTKEDVNECLDMCIFSYVDMIRGYETEQCKDFFEACNDSIKHWNETSRYMY